MSTVGTTSVYNARGLLPAQETVIGVTTSSVGGKAMAPIAVITMNVGYYTSEVDSLLGYERDHFSGQVGGISPVDPIPGYELIILKVSTYDNIIKLQFDASALRPVMGPIEIRFPNGTESNWFSVAEAEGNYYEVAGAQWLTDYLMANVNVDVIVEMTYRLEDKNPGGGGPT